MEVVILDISRTKARKLAMIILYQDLLCKKNNIETNIDEIINNNKDMTDEFIEDIIKGVLNNYSLLVNYANKYLNNWTLDRLGFADQAIILIALYELLYTNTSNKIVINEAIVLSKQYSDIKVTKMINAMLDRFYHNEIEDKDGK